MATKTAHFGTPCSPRWDDYWIGFVEHCEERLGRGICGAECPGGAPCENECESPNGRCRFHGGIPHIGAQPGNVNALREGVYARRLRPCTDRCPHWQSCPMASAAVEKIPLQQRPACIYEQTEYDATLRGTLASMNIDPDTPDENVPLSLRFARSMAVEAAEAYALSKVLAQRAAGVLGKESMTDTSELMSLDRAGLTTTTSGTAEACLKFQREQRNWHRRLMECGAMVVRLQEDLWRAEMEEEHEEQHKAREEKVEPKHEPVEKANNNGKHDEKSNGQTTSSTNGKHNGHATYAGTAPKPKPAPATTNGKARLSRTEFMEPVLASRTQPAPRKEEPRPRTVLDGPPPGAGRQRGTGLQSGGVR